MTTADPRSAFVWTWLPGAGEPVVAGRVDADGPMHTFTYASSYQRRPGAASLYEPELPLAPGRQRPVGDLTIAGCLRDARPDVWGQRVILARHLGRLTSASEVSELSPLTYLLETGTDRIGALDFQASPTEYVPRTASSVTLEQLMSAAADVENGRQLPPALAEALTWATSVGGARPKVLLTDEGSGLIAKFSSTTDVRPVVRAEAVAMELARRVGLNAARARVTEVAGKDVLLVERFDRPGEGRRNHMVSALTILSLDEFIPLRYASYADLADHIRRSFTSPAATLRELFSRIVFNILVGNTDDHPRNHAAFVNADGGLTLTPAYDICPQARRASQANQAMAIGRDGQRTSQTATCRAASETYLLSAEEAQAIIDEQVEIIRTQWNEAADAARLTEFDRQQLYGREILNEFVFQA